MTFICFNKTFASGHFVVFCLQQREKLTKDARKARITAEHRHLMSIVAFRINVEPSVVEESVVDCEYVRNFPKIDSSSMATYRVC